MRTLLSVDRNTVQISAMARSILLILALPYTLRFSSHEKVVKTGRAGKREREGAKSAKREAGNVPLSSDELALRDSERRQRDAKRESNSLIRASSCDEQQAVVLVRHPDHTVGQAC